ncbi:MAG: triose-phosphate isomerase [Chloroflexota bacterium]|nr:triose-phosphate isomerase [Chloroflexota bacterium]
MVTDRLADTSTSPADRPGPMVGTNLKMHQTPAETVAFLRGLGASLGPVAGGRGGEGREAARFFVIPPFTSLPAAVEVAAGLPVPIRIGAQTMHWAEEGAYTGEISARMLAAVGVDFVLLGHAERRTLFHETDHDLARKVDAALAAGLDVQLCAGETADERDHGAGDLTVARQLTYALAGVAPADAGRLTIAYEPVWSIGTSGTPATPDAVLGVATTIRDTLRGQFGDRAAGIPLLYGGSVSADNAAGFLALDPIDGLFVGRAAWTVEGFTTLAGDSYRQ